MYSLSSCCLNVAQLRRLDGFQAKCLRSILGIAHSFHSRVSNKEVLKRASHRPASQTLRQQQLCHLGKVINADEAWPLFSISFVCGLQSLKPLTSHYIRRQGRPSKEWVPTFLQEAKNKIHFQDQHLRNLARNPRSWKQTVQTSV